MHVDGWVADGFEPVRSVFEQAADFGDGGAAFAACHRGELVVDLWGGRAGDGPWHGGTRGNWMSVTKAMTALCIQILSDRGKLDIDAPVARCWPEFSQQGKDAITVRQVMTHSSGVVGDLRINELVSLDDGTGIDREREILGYLETAAPAWDPGTAAGYHALSYGWILGEVVRRVDGRSLGEFFREEVALPLGAEDLRIGTPVEEHHLLAPLHHMLFDDAFPEPALQLWRAVFDAAADRDGPGGLSLLGDGEHSVLHRAPEVFDSVPGRTAELGGTNLTGTARSVARVFASLAEPSGIDGVALVSTASTKAFTEVQNREPDAVMQIPIARAVGYWRNEQLVEGRPPVYGPNEPTFGHTGLGGQLGFADPVARVGAAMVRSHFTSFPLSVVLLTNALYECVEARG